MRHVISTNPYPRAWLQLPPTHVLTESKIPHPVNTATRSYDEAAARVILNARDGAGCDAPPPPKKKNNPLLTPTIWVSASSSCSVLPRNVSFAGNCVRIVPFLFAPCSQIPSRRRCSLNSQTARTPGRVRFYSESNSPQVQHKNLTNQLILPSPIQQNTNHINPT